MKVLVVDDEAILLKSCRLVLEAEGCDVIAAASVDEALAVLERQVPDLLLIDVKMPVHNGMYLMRQVKQRQPDIPIIVMSGYVTSETIQEAEELGAATFLPKPFTPDELAETIKSVLANVKRKSEGGES
jgi:DNA-binding NtrC family response regulator